MIIAPDNEKTAIINLIAAYCQGRQSPSLGNKTEQARGAGHALGWREGVAEALGVWLSVKRRAELPHSQWVELIDSYEVNEALAPFVASFHEARNAPKPKDNDTPSEFDIFLTEAYDALMGLVVSEEQRRLDNEARREKILKGEAVPTDADAEWIEEQRIAARQRLANFDKLSQQVMGK